jgi:hypothetical protein
MILMKQDDNDTDREISENESDVVGASTMSSDTEDDDLNLNQEVIQLDLERRDKTIRPRRVPATKKRIRADIVIARTSLRNLRHPARVMAPTLLNRQKSTSNLSNDSDIGQALPLPKDGGDKNVFQQKPGGGDHNVPQHQKATFEVAKRFMEAIVFTKSPWPIISDEKYSMVDEAWQLAIEAQDRQRALAGAPVGAPSVCQLPGGPSLKIDPQTREAVSVYSVFCSSIGLMMMLNHKKYS